jgi:hypothetical protein
METSINFFDIQQVLEGSNVNNLLKVIVDSLLTYDGLSKFDLVFKLVCFATNGVISFQGSKTSVIMQLKKKHTHRFYVRCALCCTLDQSRLCKSYFDSLVAKIKLLLQSIYNYYSQSPQKSLERFKVGEFLE